MRLKVPPDATPWPSKLSERHPRLSLLNLDAAAAGLVLDATVLLSIEASAGVLPGVLDDEGITWLTVQIG